MTRKVATRSKATRAARNESRSRTFTGCGTCRSRHLKCDEAKPTCSSCRRLALPCQGYAPRLLWVSPSAPSGRLNERKDEGNSFRYPLFTEKDRASMGLDMVQSLGDQSAGDVLVDLDNTTVSDDDLHNVGPFGVFRAFQDTSKEQFPDVLPYLDDEDSVEEVSPNRPQARGFTPFMADSLAALNADQTFLSFTNDFGSSDYTSSLGTDLDLSWNATALPLHSNDFGMGLPLNSVGSPNGGYAGSILSPSVFQSSNPLSGPEGSRKGSRSPDAASNDCNHMSSVLSRTSSPRNGHIMRSSSPLPSNTATLLQYLKSEVFEGTTSSFHRGMSPWKLLLLPCALETVAEITLWNTASFARRSILSTLLAKAAFHLSSSTSSQNNKSLFWKELGIGHQREAQQYLQEALDAELETEGKYIEKLMAILSVGVVSVYYHGPQAIRKLLFDAEKLIRLYGLSATKTFRHRILHHMYTHLRLILETTNVSLKSLELESSQTSTSSQLIEHSIPRSFGIKAQNLGDLDLTRQKTEEVGYNDIHLDVTGMWQATLYPEIYGVPESLMSLLSQTISLVNEKPRLEAAGICDPTVSLALSRHIRTLEQQIWSWTTSSEKKLKSFSNDKNEDSTRDRPHMESMILAMHQAVIIFFYRRVYNMSVMIIQSQVQKALEYIQPCLDMGRFDSDFSVSIGWSTFIAVCEAATPKLQELGLQCLEAVDDHGMFLEYEKPSAMAKAVWEQREKTNDFTFGWPDLLTHSPTIC